ncbi:MAG TPA: class I SAM-dependent methyltransferase [Verrucomicrobiae bacterium]|nr:class I SAM-dependent methyltransferase [Verrucomicrobiae bacterium]
MNKTLLALLLAPFALLADPTPEVVAARKNLIDTFPKGNMSTTGADALLLKILIESSGAKRAIEVGSFIGHGAVFMGTGLERTGGHLTTIEIDPETAKLCRENLKRASLEKTVTLIEGDALVEIPKLNGPFDFVFLDAKKSDYLKYLKLIEPKLKKGAVIVSDNVIKHAAAMGDFLEYIQSSPAYETVIIRASEEKGDGMGISYRRE